MANFFGKQLELILITRLNSSYISHKIKKFHTKLKVMRYFYYLELAISYITIIFFALNLSLHSKSFKQNDDIAKELIKLRKNKIKIGFSCMFIFHLVPTRYCSLYK